MRLSIPRQCGRLVAIVLALGSASCASSRFHPRAPIRTTNAKAKVEITDLRVGESFANKLIFKLRIEPGSTRIERATLAYPFAEPCAAPTSSEQEQPQLSVRKEDGTTFLWVKMPFDDQARDILDSEGYLDLKLANQGGCLRASVGGYVASYERVKDPLFVSGALRMDLAAPNVAGALGMFSLPIGVGTWLGGTRVGAYVSPIGFATCHRDVCPTSKEDDPVRSGWFFPASVEGTLFPFWGKSGQKPVDFVSAFGIGARYTIGYMRLPTADGPRSIWIQMAHLVPSWAILDPYGGSLSDHAPVGPMMQLELPLGIAMAKDAQGTDLGLSIGLGISVTCPQ